MPMFTADPSDSVLLEFQSNTHDATYREVPIRLQIGAVDLLWSGPDDPTLPLWVPGFATFGMACLRVAKQEGRAALELGDYAAELLFRVIDQDILVCSTGIDTTVRIEYGKLFSVWYDFAIKAQQTIVQAYPEKQSYAWWYLINDQPPASLVEQFTRPMWFEERDGCF